MTTLLLFIIQISLWIVDNQEWNNLIKETFEETN